MRLVCVLDANDLEETARFWCGALGFVREETRRHPSYLALLDPGGRWPDLLLQKVPEPSRGKNRMHLDMVVPDLEAEAERVVRLGARRVRPTFEEAGDLIAVLADPEGNEFCLVQQLEGAREA
ncbi:MULTISPECIES: VOC family protein [Nocardiopsidaceae]|uniref:VOC family protein n=2 Tax=Nocardiopsidaceae TaxID=83676 RepID=A0ABY6YHX7_9ACTN|nr:VOC family protein [Streptomonospora nanhaiensis]MEE2044945.1 VOC family protein [Nocardiopsis tropica]WAE71880.1 VOC family protein [Streptomonospora nanhaiensis]